MIRITFAEGMTFAQPDGLPRREAELFWRGTRLIRRCTAKGGEADALIADKEADLQTGSDFLAQIGLEGLPITELLNRARHIHYCRRLKCYEAELETPDVIAMLPRDILPEELKADLRLGHAPVTTVSYMDLQEKMNHVKGLGAQIEWIRVRHSTENNAPGFDMRVRIRGWSSSSEFRILLPLAAFPDIPTINEFIGMTVGEDAYMV